MNRTVLSGINQIEILESPLPEIVNGNDLLFSKWIDEETTIFQ